MLIHLNSVVKLIPESYCSDSSRRNRVSSVLLLPFQKKFELVEVGGFLFLMLFAMLGVFSQIWSPSLEKQTVAPQLLLQSGQLPHC